MSQAFDIEIRGDLVAAIPRIKDQAGFARACARTMDYQNQLTVAQIQRAHLSGPTTDSSLSVRSNRLRSSAAASKAIILGTGVSSTIGSNVIYAKAHEFGAVIERTVMAGVMRVKTNKAGKLARQGKNGKLIVFAGRKDKHFTHIASKGAKWKITIPARAPFGHGIADRQPEYTAAFERVTENFLKGKAS
jgi:hypothetical protein